MKLPVWTRPALTGAALGAVACAIIGFSWGGWTTVGAAQEMTRKGSLAAVATALVPYCVERSAADPNGVTILAELKAASSFQRRGIVEKAGWATPIGADKPSGDLAQACQLALTPAA